MRGGGLLRDRSHLVLNVLRGDVDEVQVVPPAVAHGLGPCQVLLDQNQVFCKRETRERFEKSTLERIFTARGGGSFSPERTEAPVGGEGSRAVVSGAAVALLISVVGERVAPSVAFAVSQLTAAASDEAFAEAETVR